MENGIAGKIAKSFIRSRLTILLMIAGLLLGAYSIMMIPREEEPQIKVPMIDIFIGYPGATPKEVETKVTAPMEKIISNIKDVKHIYSTSLNGQASFIVQFVVGEDIEQSEVKLYSELLKHQDEMPAGVTQPLLKLRSIDDVPVYALTLWSKNYSNGQLKKIGDYVSDAFKKVENVASVKIIGGRSREIKVLLDKDKMTALHVDALSVVQQLQAQNIQLPGGVLRTNDTALWVRTGNFLTSAEDVRNLIVGTNGQQPVFLSQIATVENGLQSPSQYVTFGYGKGSAVQAKNFPSDYPAVTLAVCKKSGSDAMALTKEIDARLKSLKKTLIPSDVHATITRNSGETASDKVSELLLHLAIAIVAVTGFVMLAMGWRGGLVVFLSVPVTFALTLMAYYFLHYTLNRITLFALVFIVGIVVDDSIIIAENMHRHFKLRKLPFLQAAIFSINEVGNPTILATFTVMAAVLPMAFVSGMMGPYMSPMPIGAAVAMLLSLIVALTLTPYLGYIFLRETEHGKIFSNKNMRSSIRQLNNNKKDTDEKEKQKEPKPLVIEQTRLYKIYYKIIYPLLNNRAKRWTFMLATAALLLLSCSFFYFNRVKVKMLPFDNKNEFQIVVDMPEGTTLERTQAAVMDIASYLSKQPLIKNYQTYTGTASPITFSGLVRHYDLRRGDNMADIQVNILDKKDRSMQSHEITEIMRAPIQQIAKKYNANVKLVEVSPGPPVMSTLVAEIYGPDDSVRLHLAKQIKTMLSQTRDVVDLDWSVEANQPEYTFVIDKEKAMRKGVAPAQITETVSGLLSGMNAGVLHNPETYNQTPVVLQLPDESKDRIYALNNITIRNQFGNMIPLNDLGYWQRCIRPKSIARKDQKQVIYLLADMAGKFESPVYAMNAMSDKLKNIHLPKGYHLNINNTHEPENTDNYTLKWDGEWQITFEVFRDLGLAFGAVIILIYILIVGWFQDFKVPVVMLAAIPLSLIGIILGHWILGAYFTATSMIGFIALAGVMVRNSILLIDFINIRLKEGETLQQAIIEAGAVRTTPILLTAGAVVLGAVIILFDPVFQGLAISLIGGTLTSTFLTLIVVPLLYFKMLKKKYKNVEL
ncbi:multidrug transporter AcrB [Arachidicoccus ginsenosidimutans]|uniref:efflux RND transporter permease subunit n=1 Tax=Arachidicoccus sp. BS20 TaxID=1850526 RepID=UPI0007F1738B|nr:efflux RND transporter permease subunit [Arachidicoccus sp. BS20]ANI89184.1 multidrug transporter AcrB [Arachidicoccus sp. BS20]